MLEGFFARLRRQKAEADAMPIPEGAKIEDRKLVFDYRNIVYIMHSAIPAQWEKAWIYAETESSPRVDFIFAPKDGELCPLGRIAERYPASKTDALGKKSEELGQLAARLAKDYEKKKGQSLTAFELFVTREGDFKMSMRFDPLSSDGSDEDGRFKRWQESCLGHGEIQS